MYNGNDVSRAEEVGSDTVLAGTAGSSCYTAVCGVLGWQAAKVFTSACIVVGGGSSFVLTIAEQTIGVMCATSMAT